MSNTLTVTEVVNSVTVTPVNNTVEITTGISAGSTTNAGILQLTDSIFSTSTTTAATPNAVKTAYDLANEKFDFMNYRSNSYYANILNSQSVTPVLARTYYTPIFIPNNVTIDEINCATHSSFSGTGSVRMGIYAHNGNGAPSTLILDAGTVSVTAASTVYAIIISQPLIEGNWYWLAFNLQTLATTNNFLGNAAGLGGTQNPFMNKVASNYNPILGWIQSSVTGAFANAGTITESGLVVKQAIGIA